MKALQTLLITLTAITLLPATALATDTADKLSIQGTYILQSRDLPDGTTRTPPAVSGLLTYTRDYRNFNVSWDNPDNTRTAVAYTAKYRLTDSVYQETPITWMSSNLGAPGMSFAAPANKGDENPVTVKAGALSFPVAGEPPVLVFTADGMTATAKDADGKMMFVDHWSKVE
jgi:hypothetical protein